ncbi:hypothetical protein SERLA73DRAFT_82563, partial [Serpula lacrymans var. lacrymans S7.3]
MDVKVYMHQPEGFHQGPHNLVCQLDKAIYGTKQGGRMWNQKMHTVLEKLGFKHTYSDSAIYVFNRADVRIILPVFVDDMTLASTSTSALDQAVKDLSLHFKLRDLGPTSYLLGISITRDLSNRTISLSQHQYTLDILERFGMKDCKPVSTPMDPGLRLTKDMSPKTSSDAALMKDIPYLAAVGALMYLATTTHPDIAYTVGVLARYNSNPGLTHWSAVKHLFCYLQGSLNHSLVLGPDPNSTELFTTFSDAD